MVNIAIVGVGQLGSRHLQALAFLKKPASIQVVDLSADSLKIAQSRFNEVNANFNGTISFHHSLSSLKKELDVVIVATNSKVRRTVIEQIVAQSRVKYMILEKFLFVRAEDYPAISRLFKDKEIKAWVNCPRRILPYYKKLQKELSGTIHFSATGNAWGLGCNGIHLLDLFAFLTRSGSINLSSDLVDETVLESRRPGYIEFTGAIAGRSGKHSFQVTSFANHNSPLQIHIHTATARYSIEEGNTARVWSSKLENNWAWEEESFVMPFQSQITNSIVDQLLETDTCDLTSYSESEYLHLQFLDNLISFLQKKNNDNSIDECLIT